MWLYVSTNYMVILRSYEHTNTKLQLQLDVRGSVHHSIIHIENPTRCNSVSKFYLVLYEALHVSGNTPPIIRSLKLH